MAIGTRRAVRLAVTVVLLVLVTSGCGGGTKTGGPTTGGTQTTSATTGAIQTNGLEKKTPAQVEQEAAAALKAAKSVHVTGTGRSEGKLLRLDLRIQGSSFAGAIAQGGGRFEFIGIGNDTYFRADEAGYKLVGLPPLVQRLAGGRWAKLSSKQMSFEEFSLEGLADGLTTDSPLESTVEQATLDGDKVVVVSQQDGSKLQVANTGPAYPRRADTKGTDPGRLDFSEYGVDFHITAPSKFIDMSKAG